MGSGIISNKLGGIRDHTALGSGITSRGIGINSIVRGSEPVFRYNNKDHKILESALIGWTCQHLRCFRYSCSETIPIFFNRLKCDFILVRLLQNFHQWLTIWIEACQNKVFSEIYITITTVNNKSRILLDLALSYWNLKRVQQITFVRI